MSTPNDCIFGETYGDLLRAFFRALGDLGCPSLAEFDPGCLHDIPVGAPLIRAVLRAEADVLLREAARTHHLDHLPYDEGSYDATETVVAALLDRFAERRAAGIPIPEPFHLPPPAG